MIFFQVLRCSVYLCLFAKVIDDVMLCDRVIKELSTCAVVCLLIHWCFSCGGWGPSSVISKEKDYRVKYMLKVAREKLTCILNDS